MFCDGWIILNICIICIYLIYFSILRNRKKFLLENFIYRLIFDEYIILIDLFEFVLFFFMILIGMSIIGVRSLV